MSLVFLIWNSCTPICLVVYDHWFTVILFTNLINRKISLSRLTCINQPWKHRLYVEQILTSILRLGKRNAHNSRKLSKIAALLITDDNVILFLTPQIQVLKHWLVFFWSDQEMKRLIQLHPIPHARSPLKLTKVKTVLEAMLSIAWPIFVLLKRNICNEYRGIYICDLWIVIGLLIVFTCACQWKNW